MTQMTQTLPDDALVTRTLHDADTAHDDAPADLPRGLPEGFLPLNAEEQRELLTKVRELHSMLSELREVRDKLPELMQNAPLPIRMMMQNFLG